MALLAKEREVDPGGSLSVLATEEYVDTHSAPATPGKTPDDLASVVGLGWYKPNDLGLADGALISPLTNKLLPGTRDLVAAGAARPAFGANRRNGKGTAMFAGGQAMSAVMPFSAHAALWIIGVYKIANANEIVYETATGDGKYLGLQSNAGPQVLGYADYGGYSGAATINVESAAQYYLIQHKIVIGAAVRNKLTKGRQGFSVDTGAGGLAGPLVDDTLYIGARNGGSTFWFGELAEMFVAGGEPSAQDEADLLDYLSAEWRL